MSQVRVDTELTCFRNTGGKVGLSYIWTGAELTEDGLCPSALDSSLSPCRVHESSDGHASAQNHATFPSFPVLYNRQVFSFQVLEARDSYILVIKGIPRRKCTHFTGGQTEEVSC